MKIKKNISYTFFIRLLTALVLLFSSSACTTAGDSAGTMYSPLSSIYYSMGPDVFKIEIAEKEKQLNKHSAHLFFKDRRAKLLLELAILYSHKNNPDQDFGMAIRYFTEYSRLKARVDVEYTAALLNNILENKSEYDILKINYDQLVEEKNRLARSYSRLVFQMRSKDRELQKQKIIIRKKNEIIEKLKVLDIQLENRRSDTD